MSSQIRHAALVLFLGFFVLSGGVAYWQVVRGEDLDSRSGNPRIAELSAREQRGTIWSADGVALARSEPGSDGRRLRVHELPSLAHSLGYVSTRFGLSGLEESFNADLSGGRNGDALEQAWHELTRERVPGNDLVLSRSEEHTSELQSRQYFLCRLLLETKQMTGFYRNVTLLNYSHANI